MITVDKEGMTLMNEVLDVLLKTRGLAGVELFNRVYTIIKVENAQMNPVKEVKGIKSKSDSKISKK